MPFVVAGARRRRDMLIGVGLAAAGLIGLTVLLFGPTGTVGMFEGLLG